MKRIVSFILALVFFCTVSWTVSAEEWKCKSCGNTNSGKFCSECGNAKSTTWICSACNTENNGKFCSECGLAKDAAQESKRIQSIDFADAESFEHALNGGADLEGKIVQIKVKAYHPDSGLGYNAWAGEHLNFISSEDLELSDGQEIIAYVQKISSFLGSWIIYYEIAENAVFTESTSSSNNMAEVDLQYQPKYYFRDDVLVSKKVKIEITDVDVALPGSEYCMYSYKPLIRFKYTVTNISDDNNINAWCWLDYFSVIQDNDPNTVNELGTGSQEDTYYHEIMNSKIKPNGTCEGIWVYELDDLTTPVQLVACISMDNKIGEQTYNLEELLAPKANQMAQGNPISNTEPINTATDFQALHETYTTPQAENRTGIRPEFQAAMDSYESFFDEYVAFMNRYTANPTDISMLGDYIKFMTRYTEVMTSIDSVDQSELSSEELSLYMTVTLRIEQKLLSVIG